MIGDRLFKKFALHGVLERGRVRNEMLVLRSFLRRGLVRKIYMKGRVFYELTKKALPILDHFRLMLLHEAKLKSVISPHRAHFYRALFEDVRFLDTSDEEAADFLFLGDWQICREPVWSQLQLSQYRYYQNRGLK